MSQWAASVVDPLALLWLCFCTAAVWLGCKRCWRAAALIGSAPLALFLVGSLPWPESLVIAREAPYAESTVASAPAADAVVMLGGILEPSINDPFGFALRPGSQRLLTAMELVHQGKAKALVLGGSGPLPGHAAEPAATLLCQWAREWKTGCSEILNLGVCRNTHDEAVRLKQLKDERGWKHITLVTSALHMKRAEATIRQLNGPVAVVACDFRVYGVKQDRWRFFPCPQIARLQLLHDYLHEVVGYWVYRWRGWL